MTKEEFKKLKVGDLISLEKLWRGGHMFGVWRVADVKPVIGPDAKMFEMQLVYSKITNTTNIFVNFGLVEEADLDRYNFLGPSEDYPEYFI